MRVGDICSREVYIVRPEEPLAEAVREMDKRHVGAVVVVESQADLVRPIGIVTDRDVVRGQLVRSADMFCLSVGDVMTKAPLTVEESCGVGEAIERMSARNVRRAPVVSSTGDLVGIVTLDDLLPVVAENLSMLAQLLGTQARREQDRFG